MAAMAKGEPRRANGEGSTYQRPDGLWVASIRTRTGRRVFYGHSKAEALRKMRAAKPRKPGVVTLASWLELYLAERVPDIRPRTRDSYRMIAERHLVPAMGRIRLARLTTDDVRRFLADKLAEGLSANTVGHLHALLRAALSEAVRDDLVETNVAKLVRAPKFERTEIRPLNADQARKLLDSLAGDRLEALYVTAITTGLRQGELLALDWTAIDLEAGTLTVRLSLNMRDGRVNLEPPKTARSRRTLPLPAMTVAALERHKVIQDEEKLAAGKRWYPHADFVFTTELGDPLDGTTITRALHRRLAELKLPDSTFHGLRHAAASFLIASGVPLRVVMETLGHSTITLTANTYGHIDSPALRDAAERMDEQLKKRA